MRVRAVSCWDAPPEQLLEAIRTVHRGDAVIAPSAFRRLLGDSIPVRILPILPPSLCRLLPGCWF